MKKLCLLYTNSDYRGPGMVVQNLLKGLEKINSVEVVSKPHEADYIGCLQHPGMFMNGLPPNTLMGPNLFVLPTEDPVLCTKFSNFVVPSSWVKDLYEPFMPKKNIFVWPVGIDTEYWKTLSPTTRVFDCLIYFKDRSQQDLKWIKKLLEVSGQSYHILEYGKYEEKDLHGACSLHKYAILLTGTESQGIAYMNILSANIPCYVFNKSKWAHSDNSRITVPATSVPYFDERCGEVIDNIDTKHFEEFLEKVNKKAYEPRKYILENHTLILGAQKYLKIIRND